MKSIIGKIKDPAYFSVVNERSYNYGGYSLIRVRLFNSTIAMYENKIRIEVWLQRGIF